ncbi:DUF4012 domain-containing protein [Bifidobacterium callimiconis]|uniref:Late cornified envelope protein 3C n=1 Tax=Bifidobacterium callimiconis TaxID=2306973 RepID=A0A430FBK4_9BIFI|nr:DUF4012 domain-containing protein [Bifidobacterium callimiconis]RSX50191.1 late cornified envelope protein 3C [Bifidobacterium callimiconis]
MAEDKGQRRIVQPDLSDVTPTDTGRSGADGDGNAPRRVRRRMSPEHIRRIKRRRRNRRILIAVLAVLLVIVAWVGVLAYSAFKTKSELEQAVSAASVAQKKLTSGDSAAVKKGLAEFSTHVDAAYRQTSSSLWKPAELIPYYGSDVKAVREAVSIMEDVSNNAVPKLAESADSLSLKDIGMSNGTISLGSLGAAAQNLTDANKTINDAAINLGNINGTHIPQLTDALDSAKNKVTTLADVVDLAQRIANAAPSMLGLGSDDGSEQAGKRTYIVLAQNNAELRSTGGIAGSWGKLTIDQGKITLEDFAPYGGLSRQVDAFEMTDSEKSFFGSDYLMYPQNVTADPDFPRTGELAAAMWKQEKGEDVDGVISMDPYFLQGLLKVTGGFRSVSGVDVTGDNAAQLLLHQVYLDLPDQESQDAFFGVVAGEAFQHILGSLDGKNSALMKTVTKSVNDGHFMVWSSHEDDQRYIDGTPLAGDLQKNPSKPQIGLYFNDGTMGKADWYLKRETSVKESSVNADGSRVYTVHVKVTNTMTAQEAATLPPLVRGYSDQKTGTERHGEIVTVMYLFAPADGRLVDWKFMGASAGDGDFDTVTLYDDLTAGVKGFTLQPGESIEMTARVQTSATAAGTAATLRQTPLIERTDW